ncbi:MAG: hypothetical protein ACR2NJ_12750 [Acidimicrobiales bacterium]
MDDPSDERSDDELVRDLKEDLRETSATPLKDESAVDLELLTAEPAEHSAEHT